MPKITKLRLHLLKLFRENYWLLFSGHGVYARTHCIYSQRNGPAELNWVVRNIPISFTGLHRVTHPSTNRAQRKATIRSRHHQAKPARV